jgi:hypothetical protein
MLQYRLTSNNDFEVIQISKAFHSAKPDTMTITYCKNLRWKQINQEPKKQTSISDVEWFERHFRKKFDRLLKEKK